MSQSSELNQPRTLTDADIDCLREILQPPAPLRQSNLLEIVRASILALATTASAWCAYQSSKWGGVQSGRLVESAMAFQDANRHTLAGLQYRSFDGQFLVSYLEAKHRGEDALAEFFRAHFRPEAKVAIDEWLATKPLDNPNAPRSPFLSPAYVEHESIESKQCAEKASSLQSEAIAAGDKSDGYLLMTVLFASVLFFGGIWDTFHTPLLKRINFSLMVILFLVSVGSMLTLPICRE